MDTQIQQQWEAAAWALPEAVEKLPMPFHVLAGEALDVTRFCQRNWEPALDRNGQVTTPGLKSAVGNGTFNDHIARELLELHDVLQAAQTSYLLLASGPSGAPFERANFLLGELRGVLEWFFDDGRDDTADAQLDRLLEEHDGAFSQDAVAAALFDFAELAERHRASITGLGGFDAGLIDEATAVARELRERSAGPAAIEPLPAQRQALDLRNRLGSLLYERMQRVRAAARFVFRRHSALVREVTSQYARRQRAAYRAQREGAEGGAMNGAGTSAATEASAG